MLEFIKNFFRFSSLHLSPFGRTDTGMVRKNNEDSFSVLPDRQIFLVADGMGGHQGGEVASRVAIETLVHHFSHRTIRNMSGNPEEIRHALTSSFRHCNQVVMDQAAEDDNLQGMGCTLIACLIARDTAYICHVGDVRCYLVHGSKFTQVTTDHTYMAELASDEFATQGPNLSRSVLSRAIGYPFAEDPEFHAFDLHKGDRILLCSDGLWSMVEDAELEKTLLQSATSEEACGNLVHQANEAGGKDNITAVTIFC